METLHRIGNFFILVGLALLVLFIGSILGKEANITFLILALAVLYVGYLLRRNKPINDSGRFRTIRSIGERNRKKREEITDKEQQG